MTDGAFADDRAAIETRLEELVDALASHHDGMRDAIRHALLGGGKRLRPLLCLCAHDAVADHGASTRDAALDAACAIECIHTYSLVHDDLPAMDDDDLRRGKPSTHAAFGEATAILAGDALLALAFEVIASIPQRHHVPAERCLEAARVSAHTAGTGGLITGQVLDLSAESGVEGAELLDRIHANKTARLIAAAMEIGAIIGGAGTTDRERLKDAGMAAGRAFQIVDDVLDIVTDEETLGKTPGKDVNRGKLTYPAVYGIDAARAHATRLLDEAVAALSGERFAPLNALLRRLVDRNA